MAAGLQAPAPGEQVRTGDGAKLAATFQDVCRLALTLSDVVEGVCFGTPTFYLRGKLMLRLWEDLETLVVKVPIAERQALLEAEPEVFSLTEHYRNYPDVLVSLPHVGLARLGTMVAGTWRMLASRRQLASRPVPGATTPT